MPELVRIGSSSRVLELVTALHAQALEEAAPQTDPNAVLFESVDGALAVVVPSVGYETFGIVLLEAFRERKPVVARALWPFTEIVRESGGGLLFETAAELDAALSRLAGDAGLRTRLGEAGHRALLERWTEGVVLRRYFGLIRRVAVQRGAARVVEALAGAAV